MKPISNLLKKGVRPTNALTLARRIQRRRGGAATPKCLSTRQPLYLKAVFRVGGSQGTKPCQSKRPFSTLPKVGLRATAAPKTALHTSTRWGQVARARCGHRATVILRRLDPRTGVASTAAAAVRARTRTCPKQDGSGCPLVSLLIAPRKCLPECRTGSQQKGAYSTKAVLCIIQSFHTTGHRCGSQVGVRSTC